MAAAKVSDLTLGNFLKIVSEGSVYNNLSEDSDIWEQIAKRKKGKAEGREKRFLLRSALGAAAVGFLPANGSAFHGGSQSTLAEGTAQYKDMALTVEVERTLMEKALSDFSRYGEPFAEEMRAKTISLSRILSAAVYADGTGVIAQAADAGTASGNTVIMNVSSASSARGAIGWVEVGDKLIPKNADGTAAAPSVTGTFDHYVCTAKDRDNGTVTLESRNSAGTALATSATGMTAGDVLYRATQTTIPDLTGISSTDYGTLSEAWCGLGALGANDGRKVNGITLSGNLGGTRKDCDGQPLDSHHFQQIMSKLMIAVGQGRYKYNRAMMAWEALDALVESRETDRRFQDVTDGKRGVKSLGYVHGKNEVVFSADEFSPLKKIQLIPEGDALQFHGSTFEQVKVGNQSLFLKVSSTGAYNRTVQSFMTGTGVLISPHAAAIGTLENFSIG